MEKFIAVTGENMMSAASIHAISWQESHKSFCTPEFVAKHTPERQRNYLRSEMEAGKRIWLLEENEKPVGIVSVWGSLIENLYVLPAYQRQGYGTKLLCFAMERCEGAPTLWILNNNDGARRLYERHRFMPTGKRKRLTDTLSEIEMAYMP